MFLTAAPVDSIAGVPLVEPAIASVNSTSWEQETVSRQYGTTIRNPARPSGMHVLNTSVRSASDGGEQFSCYATYTVTSTGVRGKYGVYIDVTPNGGWHTIGKPSLIGMR
jgi:hypothetical protein